jgi:hypothetical protein
LINKVFNIFLLAFLIASLGFFAGCEEKAKPESVYQVIHTAGTHAIKINTVTGESWSSYPCSEFDVAIEMSAPMDLAQNVRRDCWKEMTDPKIDPDQLGKLLKLKK